jgi:hypothetical protein
MAAAPEFIGESTHGRPLYLSSISDLSEWPLKIEDPKPYFVLFLALDASELTDEVVTAFAHKLAAQGVGYVCAWGPECSHVHDLFDFATYVDNEALRREADENDTTIMTSWHADEDLDQALYFAVFDAYPDDYYSHGSNALLAVVVDSPGWADQVRLRLCDTDILSEDVLAREPPPRLFEFHRVRSWWVQRRVNMTLKRVRKRWDLDANWQPKQAPPNMDAESGLRPERDDGEAEQDAE